MKKLLRGILVGLGMLLILAYLGISGFLAYNEDAMVFGGATLDDEWNPVPSDTVTLPWDSLRVRADDGVPVFMLETRLDSGQRAPWIIFFHGNGQLLGCPSCVERYRLLREAGFNVLAVEYRGYGKSSGAGEPSEEGVYSDGHTGWTYLTERLGVHPDSIIVYGLSLGAGVATHLVSQVRPAGLITEGAFTTLPAVGQRIYPWLPISLIMRNRFDNLSRAASFSVPWLLFHSRNDGVIPFEHAEILANAAEDVYFIELSGSHVGGIVEERDVALPALRMFVGKVFGPG